MGIRLLPRGYAGPFSTVQLGELTRAYRAAHPLDVELHMIAQQVPSYDMMTNNFARLQEEGGQKTLTPDGKLVRCALYFCNDDVFTALAFPDLTNGDAITAYVRELPTRTRIEDMIEADIDSIVQRMLPSMHDLARKSFR